MLAWDLRHCVSSINGALHCVDEEEKVTTIKYFLKLYEDKVVPSLPKLRKSVIHNDANDHNVLGEGEKFTGLIDFGDVVYSETINNLAIAIAYAMLGSKTPLHVASLMVRGYHSKYPLLDEEIKGTVRKVRNSIEANYKNDCACR